MEGYNGWANYETWNVGLWFMDDMVSVASDNGKPIDADWCQDFVNEYMGNEYHSIHTGFIGDVMNAFIRSVDWREIASHVNDDAELTDEDEESDEE
jgi:hypothetical protein